MHSLLSICINENTSLTRMVLLNSLNDRTDYGVRLKKSCLKVDDNAKPRHLFLWKYCTRCGLLQNLKIAKSAQIGLNVFVSS